MSESTFAVTKTELDQRIAHYLGYGRTAANWTTTQTADIDEARDSGLSRFYNERNWVFLSPTATITFWVALAADTATVTASGTTVTASTASFYASMVGKSIVITGDATYVITAYTSSTVITIASASTASGATFAIAHSNSFRLPDNFGSMEDTFYYEADKGYAPLQITGIGRVHDMITMSDATGIPQFVAIGVESTDGTAGQRLEARPWPIPDTNYTMTYRYNILRDALTSTYLYPAGGAAHRNTLIQACRASAELQFEHEAGVQEQAYQMFLAQSVKADNALRPDNLGYNSDGLTGTGRVFLPSRQCLYDGAVGS